MATWYNTYGVIALSAAAGMVAHEAVPWSTLTASDWGTWVGSVGTVLTLAGTIYLATSGERTRRRDQLVLARLHGSGMVLRLVHAQAVSNYIIQTTDTAIREPLQLSSDEIRDFSFRMDAVQLWDVNDLVPLIALPGNTAVKLAQIADQFETAKKLAVQVIRHYENLTHVERADIAKMFHSLFVATSRFLDDSIKVCNDSIAALHANRG